MSNLFFRQLFESESSTYTYIIADPITLEAVIIDPVKETVERDLKLIDENGLKLRLILDTHVHADHVTGAGELRSRTGAKTAVAKTSGVDCADILLEDNQELQLGQRKIRVLATPGHTNTCVSYLIEDMVFTGDSLMVRGCGRTDFQSGSSAQLYQSIKSRFYTLPDSTRVFPGHDYRGHMMTTIGEEKRHNPRISEKTVVEDFQKTMSELKLAHPKKIHEALPANLACGRTVTPQQKESILKARQVDGIPEVSVNELFEVREQVASGKLRVIDVRRPDEFVGELGHIEGAELITLGEDLAEWLKTADKNREIVFVCRSGGRSGQATKLSQSNGFKATSNMVGGMIKWNELGLPVSRS